jgi:hypothetical protein
MTAAPSLAACRIRRSAPRDTGRGGLRQPPDDRRHVDMPPAESGPLEAVFDHAETRDFVYEHVWRVGDLLLGQSLLVARTHRFPRPNAG